MKKWIFFLLLVLALGGVVYWQYQEYLDRPENKTIRLVKHTSLQVSKALSYEIEDSTEKAKSGYTDLFSHLEMHLAELNNDVSELQKMGDPKKRAGEKLYEATIYIQRSQQLLRTEYDKFIKLREYTDALKTIQIKETEVTAKEDVNSKEIEYKKSKEGFVLALRKFGEAFDPAEKSIGKENLVEKKMIDQILMKYGKN